MLLAGGAQAAECGKNTMKFSAPSKVVAASRVAALGGTMSVREIIKQLGAPARDVGAGLHVLQWDLDDGRIFFVSTPDVCGKPIQTGVLPAKSP